MPELEFGQPAHKGFELFVGLCGEGGGAVFHVGVLFEGRVEFGRDEGEEEVEEVDA